MPEASTKRMSYRPDKREAHRIVSGAASDEDARLDASVRPKRFEEYIGQKRVKENIAIAVEAARSRGEALDHVLLYGPPGLGKTTLAQIIANELNVPIKTSAGPLLERKGDLTAVLTSLEPKEVFFLDEIHRLQPAVEEILYPAREDCRAEEIARRCRGTPRIANRLLRRARDFAEVRADGRITQAVAQEALHMLGVDENGLDEVDRNLMLALLDKYGGGPVGVGTLAAALSEEEDAIEEMYEPYLMQIGMIDRTPRGRVATQRAYEYFGRDLPRRQPRLF